MSGDALASGSPWANPDVSDALRAGAAALAASAAAGEARAARSPLAAKVGQPWSPQEEHELLTEYAAGVPVPEIAARHLRSLTAIEARLERLGKITPEQRVTRNRFAPRDTAPGGNSAEAR